MLVFKHCSPTNNLLLVYNLVCWMLLGQMEDECTEDNKHTQDERPQINNDEDEDEDDGCGDYSEHLREVGFHQL